jgi:HlyD family secretion protein
MKRKPLILAGTLVLAAVAVYLFVTGAGDDEDVSPAEIRRVVSVARGDLELTVSADGVVQPINRVEVKSKASGQIEQLNFEEGQVVEKGDLLIALDQRTTLNDYEQAKADLEVAEANLTQQQNNFKRTQELFEKKLISEQERDQAHVEYVRAKANLVKAEAFLSSADERLRDTRIRVPISGIVLTKDVEIGQIISSGVTNVGGGTLLATVADMNEVYVETSVDEVDIGNVSVGQDAQVVADAYPEEIFSGEVVRIAPLGLTQQNVTIFTVVIQVTNWGGKLKAGMSASVDIEVFRRTQVVLVPNEALKDPRSEQGRSLLALLAGAPDSSASTAGREKGRVGVRRSQQEMEDMRERYAAMSPEERKQAQQQFRQRFQERFQELPPEERERIMRMRRGGEEGGGRTQRERQVETRGRSKRRVVMVREGDGFVPRMIIIGVNNFDFAEVIDGLKEGDELLIATVSRALISAEQFNERLRSRVSGMGGIGGGRRR